MKYFLGIVCLIVSSAIFASPTPYKRIFSPYADLTINKNGPPPPNLVTMSKKSGAKSFHLAFIVDVGECLPSWGKYHKVDSPWGRPLFTRMRKAGIHYTISFGGPVDHDLSTACSVTELAALYEKVIKRYRPTGLDFDIEHPNVNTVKIIDALKLIQDKYPRLHWSFTLPVLPSGLTQEGKKIPTLATQAGLKYSVNIMTMNYGPNHKDDSMGEHAKEAAVSVQAFLKTLYPEATDEAIWQMIEITPMIGVNSIPNEEFTLSDVDTLREFAEEKKIGRLSMWSINRDHPCPDEKENIYCSGKNLQSKDYEFTRRFMQ